MLEQSETIAALADALVEAQSEIKAAPKDRENPFFNSRYATLDAVWDACRGPLTSHGLAIIQGVTSQAETVTVTTMLLHESGEWIRSSLALTPKDASPQAAGSAITYARRYGLGAMVGVTAEEDDDANTAQEGRLRAAQPRGGRVARPPVVTAPVEEIGSPNRPQGDPEGAAITEEAAQAFPPEEGDRKFLEKAVTRKAGEHHLTTAEALALGQHYLKGKGITKADAGDLNRLYLFLMDGEAVKGWREEQKKGSLA